MKISVTVVSGEKDLEPMPVSPPAFFIGRESDNDLVLEGEKISRYHSKIFCNEKDEWLIEDLGSSNGTRLNGEKIDSAKPISNADIVGLGNRILKITATADPPKLSETPVKSERPDKFVKPESPGSSPKSEKSKKGDKAEKAEKIVGKDDAFEKRIKERLAEEIASLIDKLKEDKTRRLKKLNRFVFAATSVLLVGIFIVWKVKPSLIRSLIDTLVNLLLRLERMI